MLFYNTYATFVSLLLNIAVWFWRIHLIIMYTLEKLQRKACKLIIGVDYISLEDGQTQ